MAPSFLAGKKSRMWANALRLSRITDTYEVVRGADVIETTTHEDADDATNIASLRKGDVSFGGMFDGSTQKLSDALTNNLGSSTPQAWTFAPGGDALGAVAILWQSIQSEMSISSPAKGRVDVKGASKPTGRILSGKVLLPGTVARTSTGAQTSVDGAAATTGGSRGHFHLTDQSTLASITVKIQHSSAPSSAFADLFTFTSTSTGFQTSTSATTVKRYTRGIITAFTGGAGKSVQVLAAIGRANP